MPVVFVDPAWLAGRESRVPAPGDGYSDVRGDAAAGRALPTSSAILRPRS